MVRFSEIPQFADFLETLPGDFPTHLFPFRNFRIFWLNGLWKALTLSITYIRDRSTVIKCKTLVHVFGWASIKLSTLKFDSTVRPDARDAILFPGLLPISMSENPWELDCGDASGKS